MDSLKDRFDLAKQIPTPDLSSMVGDRLGQAAPPNIDELHAGPRLLAGAVALLVFVVAGAFAWSAFRPTSNAAPGSAGGGAVQIVVRGTNDGSATLDVGGTSVAGVPVDVVRPGMADATVTHGPTYKGTIGGTLQMNSFHFDYAAIAAPDLTSIPVASGASMASDPADTVVFAFAPPADQTGPSPHWSPTGEGRMIPLQLPSSFEHLVDGPWRIVVAGRGSDGNLFQFAFQVDVQMTSSDAAYWVNGARPTPQDGPEDLSKCVQYSADRPDVHICGNVPDNYSPPLTPYHDDAMCRAGLVWLQEHQPGAVAKVDVNTCTVSESENTMWDLSFPTATGNVHVPFDTSGQASWAVHP